MSICLFQLFYAVERRIYGEETNVLHLKFDSQTATSCASKGCVGEHGSVPSL